MLAGTDLLPQFVRRFSYSPKVRRVIHALGLKKSAQNLYYRFAQKRGFIQISAGGVTGRFFSASGLDLRTVESCAQERALGRLLSEVRPEDVVYDIGAHHGLYSVLLAQKVKRVIAFEPEQQCHAQLEQNLQINGVSNVACYRKAIGSRDAEEILYLGEGVGAINSGQLGADWTTGAREAISLVHGDRFRQSQNLPAPTVLKIDVEGHEGFVLEGLHQSLSLPECRLVCCEIHPALLPNPMTKETVVQTLKNLGFNDVQLFPHKTEFHAFAYKRAT
jgi:FkbM family methyltransferase